MSPRQQTPTPPAANRLHHLFLLLLSATLAAATLWASWGTLDVVSHAQGVVSPAGQIKNVQHLEGGIVSEILVHEGQQVTAGETLITLDATRSRAEVEEIEVRMESLAVKLTRLEAEVNGAKTLTYPNPLQEKHPRLVKEAITLFHARQQRLQAQVAVQKSLIQQHHYKIGEINSRIAATKGITAFLVEQIAMSSKLLESSLSNRMNHLDLLKEQRRLEGQLAEDESSLKQTEAAHGEAQQQLEVINSTFREEAQDGLDETLHTLNVLTQRIKKEQDSLRRTRIDSPVSGTIKRLHLATVGGVVTAGATLAEIVPSDDALIIEAQLPPGDISYVLPGQPSRIRLASADGFRFAVINGKVEFVSPDTLLTEEGVPYYKIRIRTEKTHFEKGEERYPFFPGMLVECTIMTGERTLLEYLLQPFIGISARALQER
ncbi:MAG: HlyD family type I secretion periplasmic adaptor subunit [Gammaproteobacteria bacterium]|nr:HlyD family type I secretion periplasmic adaptor subunit [Gammaproteobacteria bacterium]